MSQSPTLTRGTALGVIMGTAAYMSPEQARGKKLDKRTDVWAFACCLYEALTGRKVFEAEDVSLTLAEVMKSEPQWETLPTDLPPLLLVFLKRCLDKDPKHRLRDIGDVRLAMEGAFESGASQARTVSRPVGMAAAAALTLSAITGLAVWSLSKPEPLPRPVARFSLPLPPGVSLSGLGRHVVALSSDGTRLVYSANDQLYLRALNETEATLVRGTEGGRNPFFSPDGEWVGFYQDGQLKKVAIRGGAPVRLCEARNPYGASWGADDTILFGQAGIGILRVSADGGTPEVLIPLEGTAEYGQGPQLLPGEKAVLFTLGDGTDWDDAQIVVHFLDTGERRVLIEGGRDARYLSSGHLVYVLDGTLLAVPFDERKLEVTGGPVRIVEGIKTPASTGATWFSVSDTGSLVYVAGGAGERTLVGVDRQGKEEVLIAEPRAYSQARISPDGNLVALEVLDQESDIWIWDFARETITRLTVAPGYDGFPVWTPDGARVVFSSIRDGIANLYGKAADGTGAVERLTESVNQRYPYAFTPDGSQLLFLEVRAGGRDLGVLSLDGTSEPLLATAFDERNAALSPDGRWLAYQSNESGQDEIYVQPFPNVNEGRWPISRGGGTRPLWASDGQELLYLSLGGELMAVRTQTGQSFVPGNAHVVLSGPNFTPAIYVWRSYDISPDGKRFLMIKEPGETASTELILVQNWFQELERLVPTEP